MNNKLDRLYAFAGRVWDWLPPAIGVPVAIVSILVFGVFALLFLPTKFWSGSCGPRHKRWP